MTDMKDILQGWADELVHRIGQRLDDTGTTASGRTKQSLGYTVTDTGLTVYGRDYFRGVETGRPGGKVPRNFSGIIAQWIEDKGIQSHFGITSPGELRSVAYLIAHKIRREGTSLYRTGGRDDIYTSEIDNLLPELEEQIAFTITQSILNQIDGK